MTLFGIKACFKKKRKDYIPLVQWNRLCARKIMLTTETKQWHEYETKTHQVQLYTSDHWFV